MIQAMAMMFDVTGFARALNRSEIEDDDLSDSNDCASSDVPCYLQQRVTLWELRYERPQLSVASKESPHVFLERKQP